MNKVVGYFYSEADFNRLKGENEKLRKKNQEYREQLKEQGRIIRERLEKTQKETVSEKLDKIIELLNK